MLLSLDDTTDGDERLQSVCEHTGSHSVRENDSGFQPRPDPFRSDMVNSRVLVLRVTSAGALRTAGSAITGGVAPLGLEQPQDSRSR